MRAIDFGWTISCPHIAAILMMTLAALTPGAAAAQSPTPSHTASLPRAAASEPIKAELIAGGIRARLAPVPTNTTFAAGNAAFAQLTLTSDAAKPAVAEFVLEAEGAEIRAVTGKAVKTVEETNGKTVVITPALRKGKPQTLLVELTLRGASSASKSGEAALNRLRIAVREQGAEQSDSTVVTWAVNDCAGGFYERLLTIKANMGDGMLPALKAANAGDRSRPGRWLFRPNLGQTAGRHCVRWVQTWDFYNYRIRSRCVRYAARQVAAGKPVDISAAEQKLYAFATPFVSARAADPELRDTRDGGWAAKRIANDLSRYLHQDKHPALCTGTLAFVGYFDGKLDGLRQRAGTIAEQAAKAREIVEERLAALTEAVAAAPSGHPGWGAAPLEVSRPSAQAPLKDKVAAVAELIGDAELAQSVRQAETTMAALKLMQGAFKSSSDADEEPTPAAVLAAARRALGAIEAADYLAAVEAQYASLRGTIDGSISAIREAHQSHCTCGG